MMLNNKHELMYVLGTSAPSNATGLFHLPHSVLYDEIYDRIWVVDRRNNRLQVFDAPTGSSS